MFFATASGSNPIFITGFFREVPPKELVTFFRQFRLRIFSHERPGMSNGLSKVPFYFLAPRLRQIRTCEISQFGHCPVNIILLGYYVDHASSLKVRVQARGSVHEKSKAGGR
jgi:hypothetical protein